MPRKVKTPKVKKPCTATSPLDVLSNLPAHVLDDILICLPLRDAVRTSILSNKWRFNWCRPPALMLDQTLWDTTNENINFVTRFTDIIYHIMAFHVGPITKFILSIADIILNHIQINEPKLKSFDFTGNVDLISLKKVPVLVKLSLADTVEPSWKAGQPDLSKYFESFPTLELLHLNFHSVQFLSAGSVDIAAKLSAPLNCLKSLCLSDICLDESVELSVVLCLIRSSPYLQDIQIKFDYSALDKLVVPVSGDVVNEIPASFMGVTLNHLRSVKLEGISGTETEIEFIKLLLAKSSMLVRMLIQPKIENETAETRLKVLAEITKFPRASTKAEVDYRLDDNCVLVSSQ
ncbi:putative F-box/FBD/LRR-repeat protein-like [Capsicum annuum]|uniref:F-box domain-containing protein n=1 Tax=Capsicum annuum TaxID=4072 RepID=A0A2G2YCG1_CAPAN|nr:putative F-box/FBD/LRR-repeat protein-like [Capsicum annuum]KAF3678482.1 putative F-box/FBD/LRR-repeat protein-like [Capsicum annuum]PHT67443.1 hypothetical protein T459_26930 [Capsicum annuum]